MDFKIEDFKPSKFTLPMSIHSGQYRLHRIDEDDCGIIEAVYWGVSVERRIVIHFNKRGRILNVYSASK